MPKLKKFKFYYTLRALKTPRFCPPVDTVLILLIVKYFGGDLQNSEANGYMQVNPTIITSTNRKFKILLGTSRLIQSAREGLRCALITLPANE